MKKSLLFVFLLAFVIRLIALNQSLWLDEGTTAKVIQNYGFMQIISKFSPNDFHPPLYYLFMKFWTNFFGYSEIALRFPSVIFSLLTGYIIYLIGGTFAATFFLFNPLIVYYSQEARMYMMATFFLTASLYYLLKGSRVNGLTNLLLFNLFSILAFYTFYGSVFLIVPMVLYLLFKKQFKIFYVSCFMFLVSFILISPLLYHQWLNARQSLQLVLNWKSVLGTASLKNLLMIPLKFAFGRISFYPKTIYYLLAGFWTILVWFFAIRGGLKMKQLLFLLIFPLLLSLFFSVYTPLLQYFRFIYLLPIMSISLAIGLSYRAKLHLVGVMLVSGFMVLSLIYLASPAFQREDWKSLTSTLSPKDEIYMIVSSSDALKYYNADLNIRELRDLNLYLKRQNLPKEIIIIPYTTDIYGFDYKKILKEKQYSLKKVKTFRGLTEEWWSL